MNAVDLYQYALYFLQDICPRFGWIVIFLAMPDGNWRPDLVACIPIQQQFSLACKTLALGLGAAVLSLSSSQAHAQSAVDEVMADYHRQFSVTPISCAKAAKSDEIVVCAKDNSLFRLPLPVERSERELARGDIPRASADAALPRECGVFQGQRRCNLKELRRFGYGGGSVPIRVLVMLAKKAVDPDAEIGPPKGYPVRQDEIK